MSITARHVVRCALAVLACGAGAFAQDLHKDERLGFQLRVPRGWKQIPMRIDEAWIVGKYMADKPERTVDSTTGYSLEDYPELLIVAILDPALRKPAPEAKKPEGEAASAADEPDEPDEDDDDDDALGKTYRDYKEYLKENYAHGHFIEKEEPGTQGALKVTRFEIKAERDINFAERRIVTWVYETEVGAIAVQLEVTADSYKKNQAAINETLRSFKVIPRKLELLTAIPAGYLSTVELAKLTPSERKARKLEAQRAEFERMKTSLPAGWTASEMDGVFVLNHVDDRYAKKVVEHIKAIYAWLDLNFSEVGKLEHARPPIVRICKDQDEENAFRSGSGTFWVNGTHLVTHKGTRAESWEWEYIGSRTLQVWLLERDPKLYGALPSWLAVGLSEVVSACKLQSGKLDFQVGDREKFVREDLPRGDEDSMSVRTLMSLSRDDFNAFMKRDDWKTWCQAIALTRHFAGARSKKTRELFASYLNNLALTLSALEAQEEQDGKTKKVPANEEEEEKLFKEREEWLKSRERTILDQTLERTFPGWSAGDWKGLDREFRKSL